MLHTGVLQVRAPPLSGSEWVPLDVLRSSTANMPHVRSTYSECGRCQGRCSAGSSWAWEV